MADALRHQSGRSAYFKSINKSVNMPCQNAAGLRSDAAEKVRIKGGGNQPVAAVPSAYPAQAKRGPPPDNQRSASRENERVSRGAGRPDQAPSARQPHAG